MKHHTLTTTLLLMTAVASAAPPIPSSVVATDVFYVVASHPDCTVWVAPSTWTVERDTTGPTATSDRALVYAARREAEAIQVVTRSATPGLRSISFDNGLWTGPSLEVPTLTAHDVQFGGSGGCPTGLPDRLTPIESAQTVDSCGGVNQAFWLTIRVPVAATAGIYSNLVTVTTPDVTTSFPLVVHVFDVTLPASPGFTLMGAWNFTGTETNYHLVKQWFADHRMTLRTPLYPSALQYQITWPTCGPFDDEALQPPQFSVRYLADKYLGGNGFNEGSGFQRFIAQAYFDNVSPRPPIFCGESIAGDPRGNDYGTAAYNDAWGAFLKALQDYGDPSVAPIDGGNPFGHDYLSKALYFVMNEPQTTADYNLAAWLAQVSRQSAPSLQLLISEEAKPEIFDNPLYPGQGYDVWAGQIRAFAGAVGHAWARRQLGEESWWYMLDDEPSHFLAPTKATRPAIEPRLLGWLAWKYRVQGWIDAQLEDPLLVVTNSATNIHVTTTIRAELLRDAAEDYDYFLLANGGSHPLPFVYSPADGFVDPVAVSLTGFTGDPAKLEWMRRQLGLRLSGWPHATDLPADGVRPYGNYFFNFQDPAGYPSDDPLIVDDRTWQKVGWQPYSEASGLGWRPVTVTNAGQYAYGAQPAALTGNELQKSYLYDDFERQTTFLVAIDDGVYDVEVGVGRPTANSTALVTVNGVNIFGDRLAGTAEVVTLNEVRTNRIVVSGGLLVMDVGRQLGGSYVFLNSLAIVGVSPSSGDGLSDTWQTQNFGDATLPDAAPGADPDLDGADNANEFAFATNPLDSNSVSRLTAETSANELQLVWPTRLGIVYSVEATLDLVSWSSILSALPGTGTTMGASISITNPEQTIRIAPLYP